MFDTVVVPLDGSTLAERALLYAPTLALGARARLTLVRATDEHPALGNRHRSALAYLNKVIDRLDPRVHAECYAFAGAAAAVILKTAERHPSADSEVQTVRHQSADLILMATHGRGGFTRWLYGSVADQVASCAPMPVLLVPPFAPGPPKGRPTQILVALDGTPANEEALQPAINLVTALNGRLVLLRARQEQLDGSVAAAQRYLDDVAASLPATVQRRTETMAQASVWPDGLARMVINRMIDMVVLSTDGFHRHNVLGSSGAQVVLHLRTVPLMLAPPAFIRSRREHTAISDLARQPAPARSQSPSPGSFGHSV